MSHYDCGKGVKRREKGERGQKELVAHPGRSGSGANGDQLFSTE